MEAVGTFTACTMKVIPNSAMITVTTADSKYSRMIVLGGPAGSASTFRSRSRPFDRTGRALNVSAFSVVVFIAGSLIDFIVDWRAHAVKQRPRLFPSVSARRAQPPPRQL